jgi:hypothetical protein
MTSRYIHAVTPLLTVHTIIYSPFRWNLHSCCSIHSFVCHFIKSPTMCSIHIGSCESMNSCMKVGSKPVFMHQYSGQILNTTASNNREARSFWRCEAVCLSSVTESADYHQDETHKNSPSPSILSPSSSLFSLGRVYAPLVGPAHCGQYRTSIASP